MENKNENIYKILSAISNSGLPENVINELLNKVTEVLYDNGEYYDE